MRDGRKTSREIPTIAGHKWLDNNLHSRTSFVMKKKRKRRETNTSKNKKCQQFLIRLLLSSVSKRKRVGDRKQNPRFPLLFLGRKKMDRPALTRRTVFSSSYNNNSWENLCIYDEVGVFRCKNNVIPSSLYNFLLL